MRRPTDCNHVGCCSFAAHKAIAPTRRRQTPGNCERTTNSRQHSPISASRMYWTVSDMIQPAPKNEAIW